jgi:hypothetical protein
MVTDAEAIAEIEAVAADLRMLVPHAFSVVTTLADGSAIPPEALSEDHTLGLYRTAIPRKMRESLDGFRDVDIADFLPQHVVEVTRTGSKADWFLEWPALRHVRFRAERLQYLETGWWAVTSEVKYPAGTVLAVMHALKRRYGAAHLCLHTTQPMPLWIRSAPLGQATEAVEVVVQARGEGRTLSTNIHSESTMEAARPYVEAVRKYYRLAE